MNRHPEWSINYQGAILLACLMVLLVMGATVHAAIIPITITANSSTKVYGTPITFVTAPPIPPAVIPLPDYTITGTLGIGDTVNSVTLTSAGSAAAAPVSALPYSVVPSAAVMTIVSANTYAITYVNGSMTVTPRATTLADPAYRKPILMPESQATTAWTNLVPNALADYFTFVPFKNADAVALGFPATCGNPAAVGATAADLASSEDCYSISVKKFQQGLSLPVAWGFGGSGLNDPATNTPFAATTWAYGYGSGGAGWILPYYDTTKTNPATGLPVATGTPVTGNAPPPFANGTLASTGIWHWPAPSIKGTKGRPVRVQWLNELVNEIPTGFDPTICGATPADCFPYNRIVTHVHGAHVTPESDGQVHAWNTPGFLQKGPLWESTRRHGPEGTYYYPMDQESGTIWYHDHSTGLTHNNVNMGMAGFFPITDANEKLLQANNILPNVVRELGFALQDRIFYNDGQLAMPDAPILDPLFIASCIYTTDPVTGDQLVTSAPSSCSPVFMKAPDGHLVPYPAVPGVPAPAAYLGTSATLEFFGNIPVVNGVSYGKYNVDKGVYRVRFLNGNDSRTWALRLKVAGTGTDPVLNPARYLPFWQIGAEQGLLNNPAKQDHILIMPGERLDLLVDFSSAEVLDAAGLSAGPLDLANKRIIVENWAGDVPYGGQIFLPASDPLAMDFRSANIPEVMAFDVSALIVAGVPTPSAATLLRPTVPAVPNLTVTPPPAAIPVRTVSLVEIIDIYQRIMPTLDGRGFMDYGVSELPKLNVTEQWDIVNTTVDAHPMHLHQVAFQLVNRESIATTCLTSLIPPLCVTPASTTIAPPYTSAVVTAFQPLSKEVPLPHEIGYKDTIVCPPGKVTRVIATFDIPGVYVWHCHILSHEEHDMMRPLVVTTPATSVTLAASNISQPSGVTMTPVTLTAQALTGVAAYPVGSGFEYNITVAGPIHAPLPAPPQPIRALPAFNSSLGDAFNVVNVASWTPPTTAGTYVITASTKAMGAVGAGNPLVTTTMNYTVGNGTVSINPVSLTSTYTGSPKAVTILPTVPAGLPVTVTYNGSAVLPTNAGSYTVVATIVDPTNINFGSTSATLVIAKAPLSITADNHLKTYGTLATFTGIEFTSIGLLGTDSIASVTLTSVGSAVSATVAASPYTVIPSAATGIGLANYTIAYVNGTMTVAKASPVITWATPAPVIYGSTLTSAPFNATANVLGIFVYSPAPGLVLNSSSTALTAVFTPTDTANYASVIATVNQATFAASTLVAQIGIAAPYPSIQAAYNAAITGDVIKVLGVTLPGQLMLNKPLLTVTIKGGHDRTSTPIPGSTTTIQGKITVQQGRVNMTGIKVSPDITAPTVTLTSPANGAIGVCINKAISATFSTEMDPLTISSANFSVAGVAGAVSYNASNSIATFTPVTNLAPNTIYTATITTAAKDFAGVGLAANTVWTFTTGTATCV